MIDRPEIRYTRSGDVNIAYQIVGNGPLDLVFVHGWVSNLDWGWQDPAFARTMDRLASFSRLILFDKRGTGLSDRVPLDALPTLEQRMDDLRAVMDAAASERAALFGFSEGGPLCALFAATFPERTRALVAYGSYARWVRTDDHPWAPTSEVHERGMERMVRDWGKPFAPEIFAPSLCRDERFLRSWASFLRNSASPAAALALYRMNIEIDIRAVLPTIQVPTLILHRTGDRLVHVGCGRYLAEHIPGALRRASRRGSSALGERERGHPRRDTGIPYRCTRHSRNGARARDRALRRSRRFHGEDRGSRRPTLARPPRRVSGRCA